MPLQIILLFTFSNAAQDAPTSGGVIVEGNPSGQRSGETLNPLYCDTYACNRLSPLLYPRLIGIDPQTGYFAPNGANGVVAAWSIDLFDATLTTVYRFTVRDDLTWSDGTPITANDVYFSFLAAKQRGTNYAAGLATVNEISLLGEDAVIVGVDGLTCDLLANLNIPILPAHIFMPNFPDSMRDGQSFRFVEFAAESTTPTVMGGAFALGADRPAYNEIASAYQVYPNAVSMLVAGFELIQTNGSDDMVDRFINGDTNFIANPPYDRWHDLRAIPGVQMVEFPAPEFDYLGFNVADRREPRPFDDPEGQGHHPIFGDPRVIQAVRLALDVDELIDIAVQGHGQRVAVNQSPLSPAYDPSLTPVASDFRAAERLLDEAGWKDTNGDGIRECIDCLYARYRSDLSFTLLVNTASSRQDLNARVIQEQLGRVGFSVSIDSASDDASLLNTLQNQTFDAYLTTWQHPYPYQLDGGWSAIFTGKQDLTGKETENFAPIYGMNNTSYVNTVLDEKLYAARTVPGCKLEDQVALYRDPDLQRMLMEDVPFIWLYSPMRLYAAGSEVEGFAPVPGYPFVNVEAWRVTP